MVSDPAKWLKKAVVLVEGRGTMNYQAAAEILVDLGEAIGGKEGAAIVRRQAAELVKAHPTLKRLKTEFRKHCLIDSKN